RDQRDAYHRGGNHRARRRWIGVGDHHWRTDRRRGHEAPIVFTSSKDAGSRRRGDWGGVVLLGSGPINVPAGQIEGIEATDSRGSYGGADPAHDCGRLHYARIEFAGYTIGADNELNGLTLGGCGSNTDI